jgi:hypothetical protein
MNACRDCERLEHELRRLSEQYISLVVQHDQLIRDGNQDVGILDHAIKKARRRRNAAARLFLDHRINHEALSQAQDKNCAAAF